MRHPLLHGVSAAVLTPRTDLRSLAEGQFRKSLDFLLARRIRSFALNGATGEFCLTTINKPAAPVRDTGSAGCRP